MRRYLLDACLLAGLLNDRPGAVALVRPWMERHEAATSILAFAEVIEYIKPRNDFGQRQTALRSILKEVYRHFLTYRILERYADIRVNSVLREAQDSSETLTH